MLVPRNGKIQKKMKAFKNVNLHTEYVARYYFSNLMQEKVEHKLTSKKITDIQGDIWNEKVG